MLKLTFDDELPLEPAEVMAMMDWLKHMERIHVRVSPLMHRKDGSEVTFIGHPFKGVAMEAPP